MIADKKILIVRLIDEWAICDNPDRIPILLADGSRRGRRGYGGTLSMLSSCKIGIASAQRQPFEGL